MSKVVSPKNPDDFRRICAEYGVSAPTGKGRMPIRKLTDALKAKGATLDMSGYTKSTSVANTSPFYYTVTAKVAQRDGSGFKAKKGGGFVTSARVAHLTLDEIRQATDNTNKPGRVSTSAILVAAALVSGWWAKGDPADFSAVVTDAVAQRHEGEPPKAKASKPKSATKATTVKATTVVEPKSEPVAVVVDNTSDNANASELVAV